MAWLGAFLLAILIVALASIAWQAWHEARCPSCQAARKAVRKWHPDWRVSAASHRATECDRDVIAVFYEPRDVVIQPAPYVLVAIWRSGSVEELPNGVESPYYIRGRK
jgi:hypothetical protein